MAKKIGIIQNIVGPMRFGVSITEPNWNSYTLDASDNSKLFIPNLERFLVGEWSESPSLVGKWYPIHRKSTPHRKDLYFRQGKPELVTPVERKQLEEIAAILGDRPHVIKEWSEMPTWDIRRDAWALDGDEVIDRKYFTTAREAVSALFWTIDFHIDSADLAADDDGRKLARLLAIASMHRFPHLRDGEVDSLVARWRLSGDAPECSSFEPPGDALPFDIHWFDENIAEVA